MTKKAKQDSNMQQEDHPEINDTERHPVQPFRPDQTSEYSNVPRETPRSQEPPERMRPYEKKRTTSEYEAVPSRYHLELTISSTASSVTTATSPDFGLNEELTEEECSEQLIILAAEFDGVLLPIFNELKIDPQEKTEIPNVGKFTLIRLISSLYIQKLYFDTIKDEPLKANKRSTLSEIRTRFSVPSLATIDRQVEISRNIEFSLMADSDNFIVGISSAMEFLEKSESEKSTLDKNLDLLIQLYQDELVKVLEELSIDQNEQIKIPSDKEVPLPKLIATIYICQVHKYVIAMSGSRSQSATKIIQNTQKNIDAPDPEATQERVIICQNLQLAQMIAEEHDFLRELKFLIEHLLANNKI